MSDDKYDSGNEGYWFNFVTNQHEYINTPADFSAYLPQIPAAQNLYGLHLKMDKTPIEAARLVLEAWNKEK